jgi:hypothetical protein
MFSKPKRTGLFTYESKNYPDGTRKEVHWSLGGGAILILIIALGLVSGLPLGKLLEVVNVWKFLVH